MSELFEDDNYGFEDNEEYKGIRFCPECNHMLNPKDAGGKLGYECNMQGCGFEAIVEDQMSVVENLVSRRDLQKENKSIILHPDYALDPTMPREEVECPACEHMEAVFMISTDNEDSRIILLYFCCNQECRHQWAKQTVE